MSAAGDECLEQQRPAGVTFGVRRGQGHFSRGQVGAALLAQRARRVHAATLGPLATRSARPNLFVMGEGLAIVAAICFAAGTVLQQKGTLSTEASGDDPRFL